MRRLVIAVALFGALGLRAERAVTLGDYARDARARILSRVRTALKASDAAGEVTGVVTATGDGFLFLQRDADGLKIVEDTVPLASARPGDFVRIQGSPSIEGGRIVLLAKKVERLGREPLPAPRPADVERLSSADEPGVNALRVEVAGRAIGLTESGFAIDVDGLPVTVVTANPPRFLADCARTHPRVTVRGVAELVLDQASLFRDRRYVMGVKVAVNGPGDVTLVPDAAYLLACRDRRMVALVAFLVVVLVALLTAITIFSLRLHRRNLQAVTLMAERKRMADDIHDTIEQHLVGAGMFLQLGRNREAAETLVRAKREIRDIVWGLKNDDLMRQGPAQMIKTLAHDETLKGLCHVSAKIEGLPADMTASQLRDLSLIVREAIGNAIKHGGAKKVAIASDPDGADGWILRIANDGRPFDAAKAPGPAEGHFGLEGMRERARRLHATVSFDAKPAWTVLVVSHRPSQTSAS